MVGTKQALSINAAVMNCVARCAESDSPFVVLGDFLEKLRSLGWNADDIQAVGRAVLPMLGELKSGDLVGAGTTTVSAGTSLGPVPGLATTTSSQQSDATV
jgi:hypothetical protein